jgi:hypothetical protein
VRPSSEAEPHPRGRPALERGGASPEGASRHRARQILTRGGVPPSSKADPQLRGRPALERGGSSPEGAPSSRARREFVSAVSCPSSKVEFRPRMVRSTVWWAAGATRVVGPTAGL